MKTIDELNENELELLIHAAMLDFCDGYSWMFEKKINCSHATAARKSAAALGEECSGIIAINRIAYTGAGSGTLLVILDKAALFALGGLTVMQPLPRIKEQCTKGNASDALSLADAVGEIGNLIDGSFSKVLRDGSKDIEGLGEELELRLQLPVPVGQVALDLDPAVAAYRVFSYTLELAGLDPLAVKVVFPSAN